MADVVMFNSTNSTSNHKSSGPASLSTGDHSNGTKQPIARPTATSLAKTIRPAFGTTGKTARAPVPQVNKSVSTLRKDTRAPGPRGAGKASSNGTAARTGRSVASATVAAPPARPTATPVPWVKRSPSKDAPRAAECNPWPKLPYEMVHKILGSAAQLSRKNACIVALVSRMGQMDVARMVAAHRSVSLYVEHQQATEILHMGAPHLIEYLWLNASSMDSLKLLARATNLQQLYMSTYDFERIWTENALDCDMHTELSALTPFKQGLSLTLEQPPHYVSPMYERIAQPELWAAFTRAVTHLRLADFRIDDERREASAGALLRRLPRVTHLAVPAFRNAHEAAKNYTPAELVRRMRRVKAWAGEAKTLRAVVLVVDWEDWVNANGWASSARRAFERLVVQLKGLDERFYVVATRCKLQDDAKVRRAAWEEDAWARDNVWEKATRTRSKVCGEA